MVLGRTTGVLVAAAVLAVLIAAAMFGPALLLVLPIVALIVLTIEALSRRQQARHAAELAEEAGARGPVTTWGRVLAAEGRCPTGRTPREGQEFAIFDDELRPAVCQHVRSAVLREAAQMSFAENLPIEPIVYQDADHRVEIELHHSKQP